MLYLAYGSNMDIKRMRKRGVRFTSRVRAILKGYTLEFNKVASANPRKGFANIVPDKNGMVEGALYEIPAEDIQKIDRAEGAPRHYRRTRVTTRLADGAEVEAEVYIAQPEWVREGLKPDQEYLNHLLAGKDLLSKSYYEKLLSVGTLD